MGELSTKAIDGYVAIDVHPVLQRVPAQVREGTLQIYDPVLVSLGPYHHGDSRFQEVEDLKEHIVTELFSHGSDQKLLEEIRTQSREIRTFYRGIPQKSIDNDEALARMMLRDASFLAYCLRKMNDGFRDCTVLRRLGMSRIAFVLRDFFMVENQLPFSVLEKAVASTHGDKFESIDAFFHEFLSKIYYQDNMVTMTQLPWGNGQGEKPIHLLEALHRMLLHLHPAKTDQDQDEGSSANRLPSKNYWQLFHSPHWSATDLKAKGVHFGPSSHSLKDITFCSFFTHGRLHLPMFFVNNNSRVFLSNLVAYEMSTDRSIDLGVTGYVNFMKTLLQRAEDVKLLREKGVLYSVLANDDEVVGLFQDIDAYGVPSSPNLDKVRMRIEAHCNGRGKTWLAELINTYFRSPLTAVALLAAAFILVLTFLQTFYTINPRYANAAP